MVKKKKYPKIEPQFLKNERGVTKAVYLDYVVFDSILEEMKQLEHQIKLLHKKSQSGRARKAK